MRTVKLPVFFVVCTWLVLSSGCVSQQKYKDLKIQNAALNRRRAELESELQTAKLQLQQLERQLATAKEKSGIGVDALQTEIAALKEHIKKKDDLIASMQQQLLLGGAPLPVEVSTMLEDFAKSQEMVTYDAQRGIVKFKSDLLFEKGSDTVAPAAGAAIKSLCAILNSKEAEKFDVIIAGHTDDIPILKPDTRVKHPTNWHLSVHRAISVLDIMAQNNIANTRMSVRGFSEFRPTAPNEPNNKGNPQNRRVEIYIVHAGM